MEQRKEQKAVCTVGLIGINIGVFLIFLLLGKSEDVLFMREYGAMYEPYITEKHEYYRMLTCIFLHFGLEHLLNNMVMLGALGWNLEPEIGKIRFLLIYFLSGICGNICSFWINQRLGMITVSAGASGAVFGVLGALVWIVIRGRGQIGRLTKKKMMLLVGLSLYYGLTSAGVDNAAHIGGLISGFLLGMLLTVNEMRQSANTRSAG